MENKLAGIHCNNRIAATITEHWLHDFNLKKQERGNVLKGKFPAQKY